MAANEMALVGVNFLVCLVGLWVCAVRMGRMSRRTTKLTIRVQYAVWSALFTASAISWTHDDPASLTQLFMTAGVLGHLLLGADAWRYGPPPYTIRQSAGAD